MIIIYILLVISYLIIFWLIGYIFQIEKTLQLQLDTDKKLGKYIVKNKEEIEKIKNSIYQ